MMSKKIFNQKKSTAKTKQSLRYSKPVDKVSKVEISNTGMMY